MAASAIMRPGRTPPARPGRWRCLHGKKARRTTHRSSTGTKLYAVRDAKGRFKDIQTYKRAHGADIKRHAKSKSRDK